MGGIRTRGCSSRRQTNTRTDREHGGSLLWRVEAPFLSVKFNTFWFWCNATQKLFFRTLLLFFLIETMVFRNWFYFQLQSNNGRSKTLHSTGPLHRLILRVRWFMRRLIYFLCLMYNISSISILLLRKNSVTCGILGCFLALWAGLPAFWQV